MQVLGKHRLEGGADQTRKGVGLGQTRLGGRTGPDGKKCEAGPDQMGGAG